VAAYPSAAAPESKWDAIQSGTRAAREERRRLGLGLAPLPDIPGLLEAQGVRTGLIPMPAGVSGLVISDPSVGPFAVVNRDHPPVRRRFSWCHEYAHLLLDRAKPGHVSRETERSNLIEVRANVFAAEFLMPEGGVRQFLASLGKGSASRIHAEVFDETGVVPVDSRTAGGSQDVQIYDAVKLAHHFGVSLPAVLYRLKNLKLVTETQFEELKRMDDEGAGLAVAKLLGFTGISVQETARAFYRRYLALALEAYRREKISHRKLVEIGGKLGVEAGEIEGILATLGLDGEAAEVLLPAQ
jgi:Zn-dependent peptidase ImmA (M78 family)